ncbi:hypothetical protein Glove_117g601 [Diversispora epigaea]|uniref:Uncharacterized protein n=1 Tax=Diversispora epigaea TaxID=1348612 RepID=A0A397J0G4_9GLOM|nr:hypothetical protein Glove_117g601 [Diversispora epigaea]
MHSKIHANISLNAIAENIVKQAYIIADRDSLFKDTYNKTRHYPYTQTTLEFLFEKQFPLENNNSMVFVYRANILTQKNLNNINENDIIENEKSNEVEGEQTNVSSLLNMHSKIHANISLNAIAENIVKQAYIIADRDSLFKDTYNKTRHYPYTQTTLEFLFEKQAYYLSMLEIEVDSRFLPTAYHIIHIPKLVPIRK